MYQKPDFLKEQLRVLSEMKSAGGFAIGYTNFTDAQITKLNNQKRLESGNALGLDHIKDLRGVNYQARINGKTRNDGVYPYGAYKTNADSLKASSYAKHYNNWKVNVSWEMKTNRATYVQVTDMTGKTSFWIDKRALKAV